jgi:hypothetical protein
MTEPVPDTCRHIRLELVALPDQPGRPDAITRLRQTLKMILRISGWRCVSAEPIHQPQAKGTTPCPNTTPPA